MKDKSWFEEITIQSQIKREIVSKYFWSWATIMLKQSYVKKIAYIDLFAGPGRYNDGTKSTPLLILEKTIENDKMRNNLVTVFNDVDKQNAQSLEKEVMALKEIDLLKYKPEILNHKVGDQIVKDFEQSKFIPTFFFIDPWGYKGLSLRLINSVLKDWGCDCVFFFNYNRVNMGLGNNFVNEPMEALFGEVRACKLRKILENLKPQEREIAITEELIEALKDMGGKYVLPFRFKTESGARTSHYLIFVSKHVRGYSIMKDIMAKCSSTNEQGVPTFEYCLADERFPLMFEFNKPLDALYDMLINDFSGKTLTCKEIFESHHVGKRYVLKNYKDILLKLEADGKITTNPPANKRRKLKSEVTFGENVKAIFPKRTE